MRAFLDTVRAIFLKDLLTELRAKQLLPTMICLGVLIIWVFRIATESALSDSPTIAAAVLLITLLFSVILAGERAFAVEQQNSCISSLLLAPADPGDIYLAKLLVNITMLFAFEIVTVPVVLLFFKLSLARNWLVLIGVLLLANIGVCSVATLLGCVVQGTRTQSSLLSILVLAALCPLMIPVIYSLLLLFGAETGNTGTFTMVGDLKTAMGFMAAFDAIFVTVCWLLFGYVVSE